MSTDEPTPWAELDNVLVVVRQKLLDNSNTNLRQAVEAAVGRYQGTARDRLYEAAALWGNTFIGRGPAAIDRNRRRVLTEYVLTYGNSHLIRVGSA